MDFVSQYERFIHENAFEIAKNVANFVPAPVCQNYPTQVNWTIGVHSPSYRLIVFSDHSLFFILWILTMTMALYFISPEECIHDACAYWIFAMHYYTYIIT